MKRMVILPILAASLALLLVHCAPKPVGVGVIVHPPMVYVPAGTYTVGSDSGEFNERPAHGVTVEAFYIDKFEVTNAMFLQFIQMTGRPVPNRWSHRIGRADSTDWRKNLAWKLEANTPATWVSWQDAKTYAEWRGCRLPTEVEWEIAARGSLATVYPWGNRERPITGKPGGNTSGIDDGFGEAAPVGSLPSGLSPFGTLDQAGNVWEWVADWYLPAAYDLKLPHTKTGVTDSLFNQKVIRGGSWYDPIRDARTTTRRGYDPTFGSDLIGFRCVRDASDGPPPGALAMIRER
jgi:formylglycine-generating enzyme